MTTITINDKEYDYSTFTEDQVALVTELNTCDTEVKRANYASAIYGARSDLLLKALLSSLDDTDKDKDESEAQ
jgi:hypothetical protein|tara:strand:- start:630 stop:848 length:219 start_codon:yes stop_codon:yes gene_type:complete